MALLQGRELLQRERVHLAEHRHRPLGGAQTLGLLLSVVRHRLGRLVCRPRRSGRLRRELQHRRHELVGPVLGDQSLDLEPELLERPRFQRLHAQTQLGARHLVLVHGVGEPVELGAEVAQAGPDVAQRLLAPGAGGLDVGSPPGGLLDGRLESRQHDVADGDDRLGRPRTRGSAAPGARGRGCAPRARSPRTPAAPRPGPRGRGPAPRWCARRVELRSRLVGRPTPSRRAPRGRWCRVLPRVPTRRARAAPRARRDRTGRARGPPRRRRSRRPGAPTHRARRGPWSRGGRAARRRRPSRRRTRAAAQRGVDALLRLGALGLGGMLLEAQRLDRMGGGVEIGLGLLDARP